jgi:hypothetical protein
MLKSALPISVIAALSAFAPFSAAHAQGAAPLPADLGGNYQCQPDPSPCMWSGQTPSIAQNGNKLDIKNDKGEAAAATLTSNITISVGGPMNAYGVIQPDHTIQWSNGNKWRKQ